MVIMLISIIASLMSIQIEPMEVTYTNVLTAEVYVVDTNGNEWAFYGDNYHIGSEIKCIMNGNEIIGVVEE